MSLRSVRTPSRPLSLVTAAVLSLALVVAGCSSGGSSKQGADKAKPGAGTGAGGTSSTVPRGTNPCHQGVTMQHVVAQPVPGEPADRTITSFDGTPIRAHWFPVPTASRAHPVPSVLMGPGWSLAGDTLEHPTLAFGTLGITGLNKAGYNVLTWDPRGFGKSGGLAQVNDPKHEGRDVQVLMDWLSAQPQAQLDRPGDPRVGMVGFSYGGGIQLTVAAIDCRVDAIVPGLGWHSLQTSLYKAATVKAGWAGVLTSAAVTGHLDPHITSASKTALSDGTLSAANLQWFISRGPGRLVSHINAPTLFVQGTVDGLFTLDEAITNYRNLRERGVPTSMVWFCGGHGTCLTDAGDQSEVNAASFAWLARYLKGDTSVHTGPHLVLVDQDAKQWTADNYPVAQAAPLQATGSGTLALTADSVSGPALPRPGGDLLRSLVLPITPGKAAKAVEVVIDPGTTSGLALGAPRLRFSYSGSTPQGDRPVRVFAQLVDNTTGLVVGNQITPIALTLDHKSHDVDTQLEVIAQHVQPGHTLTLQLVATTVAYGTPRLGGQVAFRTISISVPVAAAGAVKEQ